MTDASGGNTQTLQMGQAVNVSVTPAPAPQTAQAVVEPVAPVVEVPATNVIPTQTVTESLEVSGSNP